MNRLPWSTMGSKNSSENHSLKQEKNPWKLRITIQLLTVSGGKCFAIFKVPQKLYGPLSLQNPGLFYLASRTDNSQHLSSQEAPPKRNTHGEHNRRYPTPTSSSGNGKSCCSLVFNGQTQLSQAGSSPKAWAEPRRCEWCCLWIHKVKLHQLSPSPSFLAFSRK